MEVTGVSNDHFLKGRFEIQNLGSNHVFKTVDLDGEHSLWEAVKPHLLSHEIEYQYDEITHVGEIFAGIHKVGTFRRVG